MSRPDFFVSPWDHPLNTEGWGLFMVGSCHGQWRAHDRSYEILSFINDAPGNGDFAHTLDWFYESCKRDGYILRIREVWNKRLADHLIKRGFAYEQDDDMVKMVFD